MGKGSKIARDTSNKKPIMVSKSHILFFGIEIEIETSIKSTFYYLAETWGKSWGGGGDLTQKLCKYCCAKIWAMVLIGYQEKIET